MMTEKKFQEYLLLYGTAVEQWPDEVLLEALRVQHLPIFNGLVIKQQYVDEVLLNNRRFEPASPDLAGRIIAASRRVAPVSGKSAMAWLGDLLAALLPQPAVALATVLTLGVAIGLVTPLPGHGANDSILQAWYEDEGAAL